MLGQGHPVQAGIKESPSLQLSLLPAFLLGSCPQTPEVPEGLSVCVLGTPTWGGLGGPVERGMEELFGRTQSLSMEHKGSQSDNSRHVWPTVARTVSLTDVELHHKLATIIALSARAGVPVPQQDHCVYVGEGSS